MARIKDKRNPLPIEPVDTRAPSWSPLSEMAGPQDADRLAQSIIPDLQGQAHSWNCYSRLLVSAVMQRLWERSEATTERLVYYITVAKSDELEKLVQGLPAQTLFDANAYKVLISVRAIIGCRLPIYSKLFPKNQMEVN